MKIFLYILFLLAWPLACPALTVTNEIDLTHNWTSYDSPQFSAPSYVLGGSDFATWFYCMYPQFTNHIYTLGEGGSSWGGDITNSVELAYQPLWASFAVPGYSIFLANNNGGYGSNDVYIIGLLAAEAPTTTFNGTALTNEAIPTQPITWLFTGNSIEDFTAASNRNNGSLALNAHFGTPNFDLYNELFTNTAGSSDGTNFYPGGHPHPGLSLVWAFWQLYNWGVETNIGTLTFDWGNAKAYTNFCAATGLSVSGLALRATVKWDRMPMAWDVPDGIITNNATSAFTLAPQFGTYFKWILQVTNLPSGTYNVFIDGSNVVQLTSGQLAAGWNMFTNYNGALWAQRKEVLGRKRDQMGCDRVSLIEHSAGNNGVLGIPDADNYGSFANTQYGLGKRGTNYTAALSTEISDVRQYDNFIQAAAQQTNHTVVITQASAITPNTTVTTRTLQFGKVRATFNPGYWTNALFVWVSSKDLKKPRKDWQICGVSYTTNFEFDTGPGYKFYTFYAIDTNGAVAWCQ